MKIERYGRFWAVYDAGGALVCVTVYKKRAADNFRRLTSDSFASVIPLLVTEPLAPATLTDVRRSLE
jgi:hypothetical protein